QRRHRRKELRRRACAYTPQVGDDQPVLCRRHSRRPGNRVFDMAKDDRGFYRDQQGRFRSGPNDCAANNEQLSPPAGKIDRTGEARRRHQTARLAAGKARLAAPAARYRWPNASCRPGRNALSRTRASDKTRAPEVDKAMTKFVYTSEARAPLYPLIAPNLILCDLLRKRELIVACARREFHASYRETLLGAVWPVLTPLIMLAIFTLVFGYIFGGKFSQSADETPAEFALAMFVGLSFYLCVGNSLTSAPGLILSNTVYVKTFSFPLEVIAVSTVFNLLANL